MRDTKFAQPVIFIVNALSYKKIAREADFSFAAGHSLGEFSALYAAGALSFEDGVSLVKERARLMSNAGEGAMCAVCGATDDNIEEKIRLCSKLYDFDIANYNSPKQIVISGSVQSILGAKNKLTGEGLRCIDLNVSGAFHSRLMESANREFQKVIEAVSLSPLRGKVVSSVTGCEYNDENIKDILKIQMTSPVKWIDTVNYIIDAGEYYFRQVGQQKHLIALIDDIKFKRAISHDNKKNEVRL